MPELPEVHTTSSILDQLIKGLKISDVWTSYNSTYHAGKDSIKDQKYFKGFKKRIVGTKIKNVSRRAKNVLIHISSGDTVLIHMKMTGHLLYGKYKLNKGVWRAVEEGPLQDPFNQFIRMVISFSNGKHLALSDMRKFAKVTLIRSDEYESHHHSPHIAKTGPEPLEKKFTISKLKECLFRFPRGKIKQVLMNPEVVAGIGNIYSDEILWKVGIHPETQVKNIPEQLFKDIHSSIKIILKKGIDFGGDSMSDYRNPYGLRGEFQMHHNAYKRKDLPCKKKGCKGVIRRKIVGGRSAHFCDTHQKLF